MTNALTENNTSILKDNDESHLQLPKEVSHMDPQISLPDIIVEEENAYGKKKSLFSQRTPNERKMVAMRSFEHSEMPQTCIACLKKDGEF